MSTLVHLRTLLDVGFVGDFTDDDWERWKGQTFVDGPLGESGHDRWRC